MATSKAKLVAIAKDDWVIHDLMPGWGKGRVVQLRSHNVIQVEFVNAGIKDLDLSHADISVVPAPTGPYGKCHTVAEAKVLQRNEKIAQEQEQNLMKSRNKIVKADNDKLALIRTENSQDRHDGGRYR